MPIDHYARILDLNSSHGEKFLVIIIVIKWFQFKVLSVVDVYLMITFWKFN